MSALDSHPPHISSIRKFSEDPRLRPFLSSHFDSQSYIKNVIKDGGSEDCFRDISTGIDEVNEEIKGYISAHRDDLMSGMQDVAVLAERYLNLSTTAKKVRRNIDKLKREVTPPYIDCYSHCFILLLIGIFSRILIN
jgi:hypothetical protein